MASSGAAHWHVRSKRTAVEPNKDSLFFGPRCRVRSRGVRRFTVLATCSSIATLLSHLPRGRAWASMDRAASHAPHHVPKDWIAKFKGQFDQGHVVEGAGCSVVGGEASTEKTNVAITPDRQHR